MTAWYLLLAIFIGFVVLVIFFKQETLRPQKNKIPIKHFLNGSKRCNNRFEVTIKQLTNHCMPLKLHDFNASGNTNNSMNA